MAQVISMQVQRGARQTLDGREVFNLFPRRGMLRSGRYLYAIGLRDGKVKIGIAYHPRARVQSHWVATEGGVEWARLFQKFEWEEAYRVEQRAVRALALIGQRVRRSEVFRGISKPQMLACIRAVIAERAGA